MTGVVVVGGSVGGVRTVRWLRRYGYRDGITLVEREAELPHDKPPLSKSVLTDGDAVAPTLLSREDAAELGVELLLGCRAVGLNPAAGTVDLAEHAALTYRDGVVIATGARARAADWTSQPGVHLLRSWQQAARLRTGLRRAERVVVIGAGFIGAEVASAARALGCRVHLVDTVARPMARHVGDEVAGILHGLHHSSGVRTVFGQQVDGVHPVGAGIGVRLGGGELLEADLVVAGLGVQLNTEWLAGSGLRLHDGVMADTRCRAVGTDNVYVVGDVARWRHTGYGEYVRSEHWTNAVEAAEIVANNIANPDRQRDHAPTPYVWSDQYGRKIQIAGRPDPARPPVLLRSDAERVVAVWGDDADRLCGMATVDAPRAAVRGRQLLATGGSLDDAVAAVDG